VLNIFIKIKVWFLLFDGAKKQGCYNQTVSVKLSFNEIIIAEMLRK